MPASKAKLESGWRLEAGGWRLEAGGWTAWTAMTPGAKRSRSRPLLQGPRRTRGSGLDREGGHTAVKDRGQDRSYKGHAEPMGAVSTAKGAAPQQKIAVRTAPTRATPNPWERSRPRKGRHRSKDRGQDRSYKGHAEPVGAVSTAKGAAPQQRIAVKTAPTRATPNPWERSRPRRGRHRSERSRSRPLLQGPTPNSWERSRPRRGRHGVNDRDLPTPAVTLIFPPTVP